MKVDYALWADPQKAHKVLSDEIDRYVAVNLGERPPRRTDVSFILERDEDAHKQILDLYSTLARNHPVAGQSFVTAVSTIYNESKNASPPKYFQASIAGTFLLKALPFEEKPDTSHFIGLFQPSPNARENDSAHEELKKSLYTSAWLTVCEILPDFPPYRRQEVREELKAEFDFLTKSGEAPASLAKALTHEEPEKWPHYVETISRTNWPDKNDAPADDLMFRRRIQIILLEVTPQVFAKELWRLSEYLSMNSARAEITRAAIFEGPKPPTRDEGIPPFQLFQPDPGRAGSVSDFFVEQARAISRIGAVPIKPGTDKSGQSSGPLLNWLRPAA